MRFLENTFCLEAYSSYKSLKSSIYVNTTNYALPSTAPLTSNSIDNGKLVKFVVSEIFATSSEREVSVVVFG